MTDQRELRYRPDIDGLRALAVVAVLGFHSFREWFPGGFVGVDVFFVISGFLITGIIIKRSSSGAFTLKDFYARRARRILPALVVVLIATLAMGWSILLPDEYFALTKHVVAAATFSSNFLLWTEHGYFDPDAEFKPLLHLWSLGIEEQFYLGWPLLLVFLWKRVRWLWPTVSILVIGSFALNVALVYDKATGTFYFPLTRFWELGIGCMLALMAAKREHVLATLRAPGIDFLGAALVIVAVFLFDENAVFPGWRALLPCLGAACLIIAGPNAWFNRQVLSRPTVVYIGLISYPLYLWHWPLLSFASILEAGTPAWGVRVGALALSFVLAGLTYHLVELPLRTRHSYQVPVALAIMLACVGVIGGAGVLADGFAYRSQFALQMLERGPRYDERCMGFFGGKPDFGYCRSTSSSTLAPQVVVLGDSHAQAIYDGLAARLGNRHRVMLLADYACPPTLKVDVYTEATPVAERTRCRSSWQTFAELVNRMKPAAVVIASRGPYYLTGDYELRGSGKDLKRPSVVYKEGMRDLLRAMNQSSNLIYVLENPSFKSKPHCFMRPFRLFGSQCQPVLPRHEVESSMAEYRTFVAEVSEDVPKLSVIDTLPLFCDASSCYQKPPGEDVLYADTDHLNPAGGRFVVENSGLLEKVQAALEATHMPSSAAGAWP